MKPPEMRRSAPGSGDCATGRKSGWHRLVVGYMGVCFTIFNSFYTYKIFYNKLFFLKKLVAEEIDMSFAEYSFEDLECETKTREESSNLKGYVVQGDLLCFIYLFI